MRKIQTNMPTCQSALLELRPTNKLGKTCLVDLELIVVCQMDREPQEEDMVHRLQSIETHRLNQDTVQTGTAAEVVMGQIATIQAHQAMPQTLDPDMVQVVMVD
jgi:hypothetical protein